MKKHKYIVFLIGLLTFTLPIVAFGDIFYNDTNINGLQNSRGVSRLVRPLGARIIKSGQSAEVACSTTSGPIFIKPFVRATTGPYFIRDSKMVVSPKKLLLGNYNLIPDLETCYNPETGAPIPAFEIKPYGVSR